MQLCIESDMKLKLTSDRPCNNSTVILTISLIQNSVMIVTYFHYTVINNKFFHVYY